MSFQQWSLPQRQDHIGQLRKQGTPDYQHQLEFQGRTQKLDVFTVEIGFPCYRLANGRTRSAQKEYVVANDLPNDYFTADPDSAPALADQDTILREMATEKGLIEILKKSRQSQPLILDSDGYVINGNRRLCIMRLLLDQDERTYAHFKHVQVAFLPMCTERDIKELEGRLQVSPEGRAEYTWVDEAMLYRDLRDDNWSDDQVADLYDKRVSDVRELIAMLEDAEQYLTARDKSGRYSLLIKKEYAFRQIQKVRKKCEDDEPRKQLLSAVSYLMLDDPESADGRLYESIPDAFKHLDKIASEVRVELEKSATDASAEADGLDILSGPSDEPYDGVAELIRQPENHEKARNIIRDVLEEERAAERERRDAAFCIRQVQSAYSKLQSAFNALDENADVSGMDDILRNIEETILGLREWAVKNGNGKN